MAFSFFRNSLIETMKKNHKKRFSKKKSRNILEFENLKIAKIAKFIVKKKNTFHLEKKNIYLKI